MSGDDSNRDSIKSQPAAQTPMMRQFFAAKEQHPDALVFFRMGDFYETFFEDAVEAAQLLELTLTSRNKKDDEPIPMAGVPHHAAQTYIRRLLGLGRKVAICEQMEDPRQAKGLVRREVVRVVTPGVVLDDDALDGRTNNFLAALWRSPDGNGELGLAWVDASTGQLLGMGVGSLERGCDELARIEPTELLVSQADPELAAALSATYDRAALSRVDAAVGSGTPVERAAALLAGYLAHTQKDLRLPLRPLELRAEDEALELGTATVRNLELVRTLADGRRRGSLIGILDRTCTAVGGRLLKQWLLYPLLDVAAIRRRHDAVEAFVDDPMARGLVREALKQVYDLERLLTRTVAGAATPRDLVSLAGSLERVPDLIDSLSAAAPALAELARRLDPVEEAARLIRRALVDEPPLALKQGGVIRECYHDELDELIAIARDGKAWFNAYAEQLREETGIGSLKVKYNNVFHYFIEVTRANLQHVPDTWLRRQTLANSERYYTPELKEREEKVLGADERRAELEQALFDELREAVAELGGRIQATAQAVAVVDVLAALAEVAQEQGYARPEVDESVELVIGGGRHPVIEALLPAGEFVPNDIRVEADTNQLLIITGPNMAGKSTVMRQVALIVVLAQMGSFVPAERARIGVVDQVFTRVGAWDNLARGQSTFMVEMTETASILDRATRRSLVIIDEIGRGTSTYDGVSIAWAVAEHLHDVIGARTLFATHYHELTELAVTRPRAANMSVAVKEWQDEIVFLRELIPGGTNRSYGIQVARLAGLPAPVVGRAREILDNLEAGAIDHESRPRIARGGSEREQADSWQLSLFAPPERSLTQVEERIGGVDPDSLTPRAALELLYELKRLVEERKKG